ncbi:hypothetical protein U1Q18_038870 [Sarracenia purpurea var. burkii]
MNPKGMKVSLEPVATESFKNMSDSSNLFIFKEGNSSRLAIGHAIPISDHDIMGFPNPNVVQDRLFQEAAKTIALGYHTATQMIEYHQAWLSFGQKFIRTIDPIKVLKEKMEPMNIEIAHHIAGMASLYGLRYPRDEQ